MGKSGVRAMALSERFQGMMKMFFQMDKNKDAKVDRDELHQEFARENYDVEEIEGFFKYLDVNNDRTIDLKELSRGLGLDLADLEKLYDTFTEDFNRGDEPVPEGATIIKSQLPSRWQAQIIRKFISMTKAHKLSPEQFEECGDELHKFLTSDFGGAWQVIILDGSYGGKQTHLPFYNLQFEYDDVICLAWRTEHKEE